MGGRDRMSRRLPVEINIERHVQRSSEDNAYAPYDHASNTPMNNIDKGRITDSESIEMDSFSKV